MKMKSITFPTPLEKIHNINNDNIDVFIELDDGKKFTLTVCTPEFYNYYMEKEGLEFMSAAPPDIIVKTLTEKNIRDALETYCEDEAYWLKLYYLAGVREGIFSGQCMDELISEIDTNLEE